MRRFVTVGVLSTASALAWAGCSDDSDPSGPTGGTGGQGGSAGASGAGGSSGGAGTANLAGNAGQAGQGGGAGAAGGGGSGGSAGSGTAGASGSGSDPDAGGDAGDASAPPPCTGCLELRAPLAASGDSAYFQLVLDLNNPSNLSNTIVTFRLRALVFDETGQTIITPFATDADFTQGNGTSIVNNAATFTNTDTFIDVALNVGAIAMGGFDDTQVVAYGIQLFAGGTYAGPAPTLLLDSITVNNGDAGLSALDFTSDAQGVAVQTQFSVAGTEIIHH